MTRRVPSPRPGLEAMDPRLLQRTVAAPQPREVDPQLATSTNRLEPGRWLFERKLDGIRILVHVRGDEVRLQSRNRNDYANHFPELVTSVGRSTAYDLVADGEVVAHEGEATSFPLLQQRLGAHTGPARRERVPVHLYLFDLVHLAGHDLRGVPLVDRQALLAQVIDLTDPLRPVAHVEGDHHQQAPLLGQACGRGWEGLIAKRPDCLYHAGRSSTWRKLPCLRSDAFVVGGFTAARGSRPGFGALLLGQHDRAGRLRYVGKVGTGFDDTHLTAMRAFLERIERPTSPFGDPPLERGLRWVEPVLVVRVTYADRTPGGRLRHPRFEEVFTDREPSDAVDTSNG